MSEALTETNPAEIYDRHFLPALFAQWGPTISDVAALRPGMSVLDVGCGTGALTLAAADCVGADGSVTGLDLNPDMLSVARRKSDRIRWIDGNAVDLPFDTDSYDAVVSQFAFMFFEDRAAALSQMRLVVKPGGKVVVAVCGDVDRSPGYSAFAALLDRLFGRDVGDAFRAPFVLGKAELLQAICNEAGITNAQVAEHFGTVRFSSIADLVSTERACVWTLGGVLDDGQFDRLLTEADVALAPFRIPDGAVVFDMPALILSFEKA